MKLYRGAIDPLQKEPYARDPHSHKVFLANLGDRATTYGWNDILYIPEDIADLGAEQNDLLSKYGKVTLDQIPCSHICRCQYQDCSNQALCSTIAWPTPSQRKSRLR